MSTSLIAKTIPNGKNRLLLDHTKMVLNLSVYCATNLIKNVSNLFKEDKEAFIKCVALSAILHDIGKSTSELQNYYTKKSSKYTEDGSEQKGMQHNIYSWAFTGLIKSLKDKPIYADIISHSILYHHVISEENSNITNKFCLRNLYEDNDTLNKMKEFYLSMIEYCENTFNIQFTDNDKTFIDNFEDDVREEQIPSTYYSTITHFTPKEWELNAFKNLCRACLIFADRIVSNENDNTEAFINNDIDYFNQLTNNVNPKSIQLDDIDWSTIYENLDTNRLNEQLKAVNAIEEHSNVKLFGNAGIGKTLIGLMWFLKTNKKTLWITPRNIIAQSTYQSLDKELKHMGLTDVNIALYHGGEFKAMNFSSNDVIKDTDILVTNIDSILNTHLKNNTSVYMYDIYNTNIIFDEYHEFVCEQPLFHMFIRLLMTRLRYTNTKSLLMSATPIDLSMFGPSNNELYEHNCTIHNGGMNVRINTLPDIDMNDIKDDSFIITHTVAQTQKLYDEIPYQNKEILHSNYTDEDRKLHEDNVNNLHDKHSIVENRNVVVGTNIIGTGLDISAKNIYDYCYSPEATIQRCCGRSGRFGEKEYNNQVEYNVILKEDNSSKFFIRNSYDYELYKNWKNILISLDNNNISKLDLYNIYNTFKLDNKELYIKYYKECFYSSQNNNIKPYKASKTKKDNKFIANNKNSIRNNNSKNVFVTAKMNDNTWSDVLDIDMITLERKETDDSGIIKLRKQFIKGNQDPRFKYNIKGRKIWFTLDEVAKLAYTSESPIPLFNFQYCKNKGLYFVEE